MARKITPEILEASKEAARPRTPLEIPAFKPAHPGDIIGELIETRKLPKKTVAEALTITRTSLYGLLAGRWGVTAPTALKLSYVFGSTPMFWMNLQRNHDLWKAQRAFKPRKLTPLIEREDAA